MTRVSAVCLGASAAFLFCAAPAFALLDPLATIEQFESGGQNIQQQAVDPRISSASGLYQITNTTWNSAIAAGAGLPRVGAGTDFPNGVMDLPADQQQQGAAYLYNAQGFSPWTCSGCNSKLASYIDSAGGTSAFTPQGSVDPVNGSSFIGEVPIGGGDNGAAPGAAPGDGVSTPFADAYAFVSDTALSQIDAATSKTLAMAGDQRLIVAIVALWSIIQGYRIWHGQAAFGAVMGQGVRVLIVTALIVTSTYFATYLQQFFTVVMPLWIAQHITGGTLTNPGTPFDGALLNFQLICSKIFAQTGPVTALGIGPLLAFIWAAILLTLGVLFAPFIAVNAALRLTVVLMPLLLLGVIFSYTRKYFDKAIDVIVTLLLGVLLLDLLSSILATALAQKLATISLANGPWAAAFNLSSVVVTIVLIGVLLWMAWVVVHAIGGGPMIMRVSSPWTAARNAISRFA